MTKFRTMGLLAPVLAAAMVLPLINQAGALTVTNRDAAEMEISVVEQEGQPAQAMMIKSQETLDSFCQEGCVISLANGETDTFEGDEIVTIQNGQFTVSE